MKNVFFTLIIAVLIVIPVGNLLADEKGPGHTFQYGLWTDYRIYEEPGFMSEQGPMIGIYLKESLGDSFKGYFEVDLGGGFVNYDGQTQGGTPVKIKGIMDILFNTEIAIGPRIHFGRSTRGTTWNAYPTAGIGYRFLSDHLNKASGGYLRFSNYFYLPLGLRFQMDGKKYSLHIKGQYNLFMFGVQVSHLSDADPGLSDLKNSQNNGYGYKIEVEQIFHGGSLDWGIGVGFNFWSIADSEVMPVYYNKNLYGYGKEPYNTTKRVTVRLFISR